MKLPVIFNSNSQIQDKTGAIIADMWRNPAAAEDGALIVRLLNVGVYPEPKQQTTAPVILYQQPIPVDPISQPSGPVAQEPPKPPVVPVNPLLPDSMPDLPEPAPGPELVDAQYVKQAVRRGNPNWIKGMKRPGTEEKR